LSTLELYRERVKGTTIDAGSLLSTDYFNLFNEVTMLLGLLPDMPEMMEEIEVWHFKSYEEHFRASGLAFAPLAIEAYAYVPAPLREQFDQTIEIMRQTVEEAQHALRELIDAGQHAALGRKSADYSRQLRDLVEMGSAIVHSHEGSLDQSAIDELF
jgi:hypothetical protein